MTNAQYFGICVTVANNFYLGFLKYQPTTTEKRTENAKSFLRFILDFDFIFRLFLLQVILMNMSNFNSYVQGKQLDIF